MTAEPLVHHRVLMLVTSARPIMDEDGHRTGYYLPEAAHAYETFIKHGLEVDVASPEGGLAPLDEKSVELFATDELCKHFLADEHIQMKFRSTKKIEEVNPKLYEGVFIVGGHGPLFDMTEHQATQNLISAIYEQGGVVAAVCHGPAALLNVRLNDGSFLIRHRELTGLSNSEEPKDILRNLPYFLENKLKERGAKYSCAPPEQAHVVQSDRLFTGQNPASTLPLATSVLQHIFGGTEINA